MVSFVTKTIQFVHFVLPVFVFWVGVPLTAAGIFIRIDSVWTLRKYFSPSIQVNSEQKIVQEGLYRYIRHPAYCGSILAVLGVSVCFRSPLGMLATILVLAAVYGYRIKTEEKTLEKNFGSVYTDYESQTWKIVPHVW